MKSLPRIATLVPAAVAMALTASCSGQKDSVEFDQIVKITKEKASPFNNGVFQGWGSSFCWWANRLGYSDELAQQTADLFYSEDKGIGLNIIRYNIGGGDDPTHTHIRRTDSEMPGFMYIDQNGERKYDWTADANQRNALKKAMEACGQGVIVEAFSNSPPYFMTNSGCSSGAVNSNMDNLREDEYENFAEYMATVMEHYKNEEGISFQSVDPMNEPATSYWGAYSWKQEGCHFDAGKSQSRILEEMHKALLRHNLNDVILCGTDETDVDQQISSWNRLSDEAKSAVSRIDTHTYSGSLLKDLRETAVEAGKNLWMSEVDGGNVAGIDAGQMGAGLWLGNKIVSDMNGLLPSAWILWQIVDNHISSEGYNGKPDSGMPDTNRGYWGVSACDHDNQKIIPTKKYYAFGQFTKFIRPGATILESSEKTLAAYDRNRKQVIVVAVNDRPKDLEYKLDLSSFKKTGKTARVVRTSGQLADGENLAELEPINVNKKTLGAHLLANSITTYIIDGVF